MAEISRKVIFVHFHPLEQYPPAMNLVDYLGQIPAIQLKVITNKVSAHRNLKKYQSSSDRTTIYRPARDSVSGMIRYFNYVFYYLSSFFIILFQKPDAIIYTETLSAWPAILFKRWRKKKLLLLAHYHEYATPVEYETRMFLSKWMHKMELKDYAHYDWISQTNAIRLQKFVQDAHLKGLHNEVLHTFANYPPSSWLSAKVNPIGRPVRLVYVGSLGYGNMYLKELIEWILQKGEKYILDIYAHNIDEEAKQFLDKHKSNGIRFCGGCDYQALPQVLKDYDVGLVIYKPFSENTIHAVSNKVFEYLACGLDVWFSEEMTFTLQYTELNAYPKIVPVDFRNLSAFDDNAALDRDGLTYKPCAYFYETEYQQMANLLLGNYQQLN
ncbi:MAG: hypothetical protein NTZ41_00970 [Sphingobacteriales bacterium]|nr:hypothetical protein [Sphingobacteriales bacterium]